MLLIQRNKQNRSSVGCVNLRARLNGLKLRLMILFTILTFASGCAEITLLASGAGIAASHNAYVKVYNGVDVLTIMKTKKGIKSHIYTNMKELYKHTKFGEEN